MSCAVWRLQCAVCCLQFQVGLKGKCERQIIVETSEDSITDSLQPGYSRFLRKVKPSPDES